MTFTRALCLVLSLFAGGSCNREPKMSPAAPSSILSPFESLRGGLSQAIAPGPTLLTLGAGATWWEHDVPVTVAMPGVPSDGARWLVDGKQLRVGIGTLDLAARAWHAEPGLEALARPGPDGAPVVKATAWLPDAQHVAMIVANGANDRGGTEIVIAAADGTVRGRRAMDGATALVAAVDRVLVAAERPAVLDRSAAVIAEPTLPDSLFRVREGADMFAAVGAAGDVALVRASDGVVVATWDAHAFDAVPVTRGLVAIDLTGTVRIACLEHGRVHQIAEAISGTASAIIRVVGDRLVVSGAGSDPVRVARFSNPCR